MIVSPRAMRFDVYGYAMSIQYLVHAMPVTSRVRKMGGLCQEGHTGKKNLFQAVCRSVSDPAYYLMMSLVDYPSVFTCPVSTLLLVIVISASCFCSSLCLMTSLQYIQALQFLVFCVLCYIKHFLFSPLILSVYNILHSHIYHPLPNKVYVQTRLLPLCTKGTDTFFFFTSIV